MPDTDEFPGANRFDSLASGIAGADVVMSLRIQRERMAQAQIPDTDAYFREFGITNERLALAAPGAVVMHPGPMNRGVEIASDVADGPASAIQQQVTNGVAVRMAVLATIVRNVQVRNVEAGRRAG
jgi:aspartate carbamoyltransferase catalytic subunit